MKERLASEGSDYIELDYEHLLSEPAPYTLWEKGLVFLSLSFDAFIFFFFFALEYLSK